MSERQGSRTISAGTWPTAFRYVTDKQAIYDQNLSAMPTTATARTNASPGPGIEIRDRAALQQREREQLASAKLLKLAPVEAWTVLGSNRQNGYATHGIFRYFGKFPPPIASHLITQYTEPGARVFDPMCGSGTTGVEAMLLGRQAELRDVNPLSLLVARAKTRPLSAKSMKAALARVRAIYSPATAKEYPTVPSGLRNPEHWFLNPTAHALRGLHRAISAQAKGPSTDVLWLAFAATVRRVSRATTQQGRLFLDADSAIDDPRPLFERRAHRAIAAIAALPKTRTVRVAHHDARAVFSRTEQQSADLVILHPPYFNAYRYSRINSLELAWLGESSKAVRPKEVREFFKVGKPERVDDYVADMQQVLGHAAQLLRPGGHLGLMIGDTVLKNHYLPVTRMLLDGADAFGLDIERVAIRVPQHTEATWVASQRRQGDKLGAHLCDFVVILRARNAR